MSERSKELQLPPLRNVDLPSFEISSYGVAHLVADRLGIQEPPVTLVGWMHGWNHRDLVEDGDELTVAYDIPINEPGQPIVVIPAQKRRPYLVANTAQEAFLRSHGFPDTRAVGLPFVYVDPDLATRRIPGSLLVMPPRDIVEEKAALSIEAYLDYIRSISGHFSRVVFCLHMASIGEERWMRGLKQHGFDFVIGAGGRDRNALFRMRKIFDSFEYMTSNMIGSHVLYATFCGVKVSMTTPYVDVTLDMFKNERGWGDPVYMKKVALYIKMGGYAFVRKKFPWLFTEPQHAEACVEWARKEIGFDNKVSFEELGRLFGWIQVPPPDFSATVVRLDESDDFKGFLSFIGNKQHDPHEVLGAMTRLFARQRLRSAFVLAMLLANRGVQNPIVSVVLSVGGMVFNMPIEEARGLQTLQAQVDEFPASQQEILYRHAMAPVLKPLLVTALQQGDEDRVQRILEVMKAAVPRFRTTTDWHLNVVEGVVYKSLF